MTTQTPVTKADLLRQLEAIKQGTLDPVAGIFGPDSMFWQIGKYSTAFVGAGRAALLQTAHPWVATGVKQHSRTMDDPLSRFRGTFTNVFAMVYGSLDRVLESSLRVHNFHTRIKGTLEEDAGAFAAGSRYQANSVEAMIWVHATLWETSVKMYEMIIRPLGADEKERYYQETRLFAWLFGIPDDALPRHWPDFLDYNRMMWESDVLTVTTAARDIKGFLFSFNRVLTPALSQYEVVTSMMMPPRLREQYGMPPATDENLRTHDRYIGALKKVYPRLPRALRYMPPYVEARRRMKGKTSPDLVTAALNKLVLGQANLVSR